MRASEAYEWERSWHDLWAAMDEGAVNGLWVTLDLLSPRNMLARRPHLQPLLQFT